MARTSKEREMLTAEEMADLGRDRCPDCNGAGFLAGPCGGLSQNIKCANPECGSRFNVMGPFGVERISDAKPDGTKIPPANNPYRGFIQRIRDRFNRGEPV